MRFLSISSRLHIPPDALPWCAATALLHAAGRLAYPLAVVLFSAAMGKAALALLAGSMGIAVLRAFVTDLTVQRVRADVFRRLALAIEQFPALLPASAMPVEQLETQVARGVPWLEARVASTLPSLFGHAVALPVIAVLAWREVGWLSCLLAAFVAGLALAFSTVASRRAGLWSDRAWERFQHIASLIERGLRGRVELRVHGLARAHQHELRARAAEWARMDRKARLALALTGWAVPAAGLAFAVIVAEAAGIPASAWILRLAVEPEGNAVRAGLFLLASLPLVLGTSRNLADLAAERPHLRALLEFERFAQDAAPAAEAVSEPIGEVCLRAVEIRLRAPSDAEPTAVCADFSWRSGESLALMGPNGCGKTTVALAVVGAIAPTEGDCKVRVGARWLEASALRGAFAYLSQDAYFDETETVLQAVRFVAPGAAEPAIVQLIQRLWPESARHDVLRLKLSMLSSGERRLIALARVLLRDAPLLILDEPEANLGAAARERVASLLEEQCKLRRMLVLTHDHGFARLVDRVLEFDAERRVSEHAQVARGRAEACGGR